MNLRRMNASERTKTYAKFAVILVFLFILLLYVPLIWDSMPQKNPYKVPLENRTCDEIYDKTVHGILYSDNHSRSKLYKPESIILYWERNCNNATMLQAMPPRD